MSRDQRQSNQPPFGGKKNSSRYQWELKVKPNRLSKAREFAGDQVVIGLSFASDRLREWRDRQSQRSNVKTMQLRIIFDAQLKNGRKK